MEKQRLIVPNRQVTSLEEAIKIVNEMAANYINKEISDEEIEDIAWEKFITDSGRFGFISGAKWYREQLKQRQ